MEVVTAMAAGDEPVETSGMVLKSGPSSFLRLAHLVLSRWRARGSHWHKVVFVGDPLEANTADR